MDDLQTWRELLKELIRSPKERQRIAEAMGIKPITLTRWVSRKSRPRLENLRTLLNALPQQREQLRYLLTQEYSEFLEEPERPEPLISEIPAAFYGRVINTSTTSPPILRKATICTLVLQQLVGHLDSRQHGMMALIILCVPPRVGRKVRSLRSTLGRGNPPWESHLEHRTFYQGAEAQAGQAVRTGHAVVVQTREERTWLYPAHGFELEGSSVGTPLLLGNQTAGCLYVASTQEHYFTQAHLDLIQAYVDLLVVAFDDEDFYPFSSIELELMPREEQQQPFLAQFRQRVTQHMIQSTHEQQPLTRDQAELKVWQELEDELLFLALHPSPPSFTLKMVQVANAESSL